MKRIFVFLGLTVGIISVGHSQASDSVDVTFYYKTSSNLTAVFLPGEFNNWGPNAAGVISLSAPSRMTMDIATGVYWKTVRLRVGGNPTGGVPGAYQYKINENGSSNGWLSDPMNPRQNAADNGNSIIYLRNPTILYLQPNEKSSIVTQQHPTISAYIYPSLISALDTTSMKLAIDTAVYPIPPSAYNHATKSISFKPPVPLENGTRKIKLLVKNFGGSVVADSVSIVVQAGAVQILNQSGYTTVKDTATLVGSVEDTTIHSIKLVHNVTDSQTVNVAGGKFTKKVGLAEGQNTFRAVALDSTNAQAVSSLFVLSRIVSHAPNALITFVAGGGSVTVSGEGSTDPDSGQTALLSYSWSVDPHNPAPVDGVQGSTTSKIDVSVPSKPGEYYFGLIASDPNGNKDTTRSYFTVNQDGSVTIPTLSSNPQWVKMGRIYEVFFNSFTPEQTINAAAQKLDYLQRLGVNILWIMPIMKNNARIDNGPGPGYNIIDFYTVAPEYGTNADFKSFVQQAHNLGMKVILDVTPNHTSYNHPFVKDARLYSANSFYWSFYEHQLITNPNYHPDLSESITNDGFVYYGAFGDQILNYNWADADARAYMIGVFDWWVKEEGIDGYRFDVYWGPHARENGGNGGETDMGLPVRKALKHIKPDVFVLGEAKGTGGGTETYYGDRNGGADAAYDWSLLQQVVSPFNVSSMNNYVTNFGGDTMGFVPGPNSRFMRFMENHDEERVAYLYGSYAKTMPMGTMIFTVPGIPMIYSGQEVGFGIGITNYDQRRRGIIDWNSAGKSVLSPHYQRLAWIRATYPAFSTLKFFHLASGNGLVYAYTRPFLGQNGIAMENFSSGPATASIAIVGSGINANVFFNGGAINGKTYYLNDVYNDTSYAASFSSGTMNFGITLPPFGSAVFVLADSIMHLSVPALTSVANHTETGTPTIFSLEQNFPNPFNPSTTIRYSVPTTSRVSLIVYDILGRKVAVLVDGQQTAGIHDIEFDGKLLSSGVYYCRLSTNGNSEVKRMMLVK